MLYYQRRGKGCTFYSVDGHTITSCSQTLFVGNIMTGDDVIKYIESQCTFEIIESNQSCNVLRKRISWMRIKHINCQ